MDKIFIYDLQVDCRIGIYQEELVDRQPLMLDLELAVDTRPTAASDNINDAIDYTVLREKIIQWVELSNFNLLETLGHSLANYIMQEFGSPGLRLKIYKINIQKNFGAKMGVEITRGVFD